MFKKILIANRGEIACRVIKTARRMEIATVAVYSEADADALHVRLADEAVAIGPASAAESYLVIERIVAAARDTGAEAVHPGFGFLSENAAFVRALEAAGIVFIGPDAEAIEAMGDKLASKRIAARAGVSTVPGHDGIVADAKAAVRIAAEIGYPVMIKASAGGGGKGMRVARDQGEAREGFVSAASEAKTSFGDERILIEKFIDNPRHIEIQVLADGHGAAIHLGERECSIQRRHQKVIEEAPSPFLDAATRAAMGAQAVTLARAVGYRSAGTVEFIVGADRSFYFLEMNTRLQVEHPVTELVTGIDLVEQMIRVAAGEPLAISQDNVASTGWAIEGRVYAEDPRRGFLPAPGRLTRYRPPAETGGVRVDTGVYEGAEVSLHYDPMIAKLCAWGEDRAEAIARMSAALDGFGIEGPGHNLDFLAAVMRHPRFVEGRLDTGFIDAEYPDGFAGAPLDGAVEDGLIAAAALVHARSEARARRISGQVPGHRPPPETAHVVSLGAVDHAVGITLVEGGVEVIGEGRRLRLLSDWTVGDRVLRGDLDGRPVTARVAPRGVCFLLDHGGVTVAAVTRRPRAAELAATMPVKPPPDLSRYLLAPMPGRVVAIAVAEGQAVAAGDRLAVIDAMKMENVLRAERAGRVARVAVAPGDSIGTDAVILEFE